MLLLAGWLLPALSVTAQPDYTNGLDLFDETVVHRIDVTLPQQNFWDSLEYYYNEAFSSGGNVQYMMATVSIDGNIIDSVGFKEKGFYSNWGAENSVKKPFKINLSKYIDSSKYDGVRKINLSNGFEDPTCMRDVLAYKFMREAGIMAPRTAYTKLYINNTYWGLYIMVEEVDKRFLKNWYDSNEGNLYKCISNTTLSWQGTQKDSYKDEFELQTNDQLDDWSQFIRFVNNINNSGAHFHDSLEAIMDVNQYLYVLAADIMMYNWDSYYEHGRNFFVYHNQSDHRMNWIPWDYNLAFSNSETPLIIDYSQSNEPKPLVNNIQDDPVFKKQFLNSVCILNDNYFKLAYLEPFINTTAALIRPALNEDPNKFFTIANFDTGITSEVTAGQWGSTYPGLKNFISNRHTQLANQLSALNHQCTSLGLEDGANPINLKLYPNPSGGQCVVQSDVIPERIELYTLSGQLLQSVVPVENETEISLAAYGSGMYLVRVSSCGFMQHIQVTRL